MKDDHSSLLLHRSGGRHPTFEQLQVRFKLSIWVFAIPCRGVVMDGLWCWMVSMVSEEGFRAVSLVLPWWWSCLPCWFCLPLCYFILFPGRPRWTPKRRSSLLLALQGPCRTSRQWLSLERVARHKIPCRRIYRLRIGSLRRQCLSQSRCYLLLTLGCPGVPLLQGIGVRIFEATSSVHCGKTPKD